MGSTNYDLEFQMNTLRTHPHPIHVHTYIHTQAHLATGVYVICAHTRAQSRQSIPCIYLHVRMYSVLAVSPYPSHVMAASGLEISHFTEPHGFVHTCYGQSHIITITMAVVLSILYSNHCIVHVQCNI